MKRICLLAITIGCLLLSSCALLPEEEVFSVAPMTKDFEGESYEIAYVDRGDIELSRNVSLTYVPVQTDMFSFSVAGEYVDAVFVQVGDSVEKDQLLMQLRLSTYETRVENCEKEIGLLKLKMTQLEERRALALESARIQMEGQPMNELTTELNEINKNYDEQRAALEDSLYLQTIQLEEYQNEVEKRQIRANFPGTITYIRNMNSGYTSVLGERVISVADSTMSLFRADTDLWPYFEEGMEFAITANGVEYEAVVASEETLGLPPQDKVEGQRAYVYLALKNPTFDLEDGDKGTLKLVLDARTDVLRVPRKAVTVANDEYIIYYQNEQGIKSYKVIEAGLVAGNMVEVISGLSEGESVIVG